MASNLQVGTAVVADGTRGEVYGPERLLRCPNGHKAFKYPVYISKRSGRWGILWFLSSKVRAV